MNLKTLTLLLVGIVLVSGCIGGKPKIEYQTFFEEDISFEYPLSWGELVPSWSIGGYAKNYGGISLSFYQSGEDSDLEGIAEIVEMQKSTGLYSYIAEEYKEDEVYLEYLLPSENIHWTEKDIVCNEKLYTLLLTGLEEDYNEQSSVMEHIMNSFKCV